MAITLRPAMAADAAAVADVYLASRRAFVGFAPLVHTDAEVRHWIAGHLISLGAVTVAVQDAQTVGFLAVSREDGFGWIDQLYLAPGFTGNGIGTRLLTQAKSDLGSVIRLHTFQANAGARRFYERQGFHAIAFGDGSANEENCPDVLYEWTGLF